MTSEVTSDLKLELIGLNNPCSSASLASIVLYLTNIDGRKSQISSIDSLEACRHSLVKISSLVEAYINGVYNGRGGSPLTLRQMMALCLL